jgi:hypothetical protein
MMMVGRQPRKADFAMSKGPAKFTQTDIKRLCEGARAARVDHVRVMLGEIPLIIPLSGNAEAPIVVSDDTPGAEEWDDFFAGKGRGRWDELR